MGCTSLNICAGDLDTYIEFLYSEPVDNGCGPERQEPVVVATDWAQFKAGGGGEPFRHQRLESNSQDTFTIRYRDDITTKHTLRCDGDIYNIRHINNVQRRNEWLQIKAERGALT